MRRSGRRLRLLHGRLIGFLALVSIHDRLEALRPESPARAEALRPLFEQAAAAMSPGATRAAIAIVDSDSFYVAGYFEETTLARIHVGDPVAVRLMGRDGDLAGHVDSIARAIVDRDNASGDLIANVNPSFSWVRLAQRVPVRVRLDAAPDDLALTAGLTATVVVKPQGGKG